MTMIILFILICLFVVFIVLFAEKLYEWAKGQ